jgi:hypothetical protein
LLNVDEPPAVVSTTFFAPSVTEAGVVIVIEVAVFVSKVAGTPPTVTAVVFNMLVPVIAETVPPAVEPEVTESDEIVGAVTYVKAPVAVTVPPAVVTTMFFAPAVLGPGVVIVREVEVFELRVAATPSTVTAVALSKFVPVITVVVPPAKGPAVTESEVNVGTPAYR